MNLYDLDSILLEFPGSQKSFPFDDKTPVYKVGGKMFALVGMDSSPLQLNLKCNPDDALILRSQFPAIIPGYHMNKDHWNTLVLDGTLDQGLVVKLISDSYSLVVGKLTKKQQLTLQQLK